MSRFLGLNNKGTSLVEVLVTMVVLAGGILVLVQTFPTGFLVIKSGEKRSVAVTLAQGELNRWTQKSDNLPDAIVAVDDANPDIILSDQTIPGIPSEFHAFDPEDLSKRGNVLNVRRVIGETADISEAAYFQTAAGTRYGSRYMLAFGPVDTYRDGSGNLVRFAVRGNDMRRVSNGLDPVREDHYAAEYGDPGTATIRLRFTPNLTAQSKTYYITFNYWFPGPLGYQNATLLNQPITVPAGDSGNWQDVTGLPADSTVVAYSEKVSRAFTENTSGAWSTDDPYEFTLDDTILGVISFNPRARFESSGKAKIDYLIYDLRILHEDIVVPSSSQNTIPIKLSLPNVLGVGNTTDNPDEQMRGYPGLMKAVPAVPAGGPTTGIPQLGTDVPDSDMIINGALLIVDVSTGLVVDPAATPEYPDGIDYRKGIVYLSGLSTAYLRDRSSTAHVVDNVSLAGRQLRFYYRAAGDWTVQFMKASSSYGPDYSATPAALDYRHFWQSATSPMIDPTIDGSRIIYFSNCNSGESVLVDYTFDDGGVERKVAGESYHISDDFGMFHFFDPSTTDKCYIRLNQTPIQVYAVTGASVKARVIWRDSKTWRHVDIDSLLMHGMDK